MPDTAPLDPSAGGGNRGRGALVPLRKRDQSRSDLTVRCGSERPVEAFVHLLVRDAPLGIRLLETLHGRVAVVLADQ
jgi:hypothetical protein